MNTPYRILFIRTDRMGDVLMNLPAVRLLRQTYPKAWICFLADASVAPLLKNHPDLDEVIPVNASRLYRDLAYLFKTVKKIRQGRFDLAVVSNPHKHLHTLVFFAGIRERIGYARKWPFLLSRTLADDKARVGRHEIESNLNLIKSFSDQTWDGQCVLPAEGGSVSRVSVRLSEALGAGSKCVAVHAGTSNPSKRWTEEGFAAVGEWLAKQTFLPLLIGGEEEKRVSSAILKKINGPALDWTGSLSLEELAALFHDRRVKALVSCDSGPVHVAWMSGTPVVALYAQDVPGSNPRRWGPRDGCSEVIYKPMNEITAVEVIFSLRRIFKI